MQSGDGDPLVSVNRRIEIAGSRFTNIKIHPNYLKTSKNPLTSTLKASVKSTLLYGCEPWKPTTQVQRKLSNTVS